MHLHAIWTDLQALAAEVGTVDGLNIPHDRHDALHRALDEVEAVLDTNYLRCGDCGTRMSADAVLSHVCNGRFCRVQCGDCGMFVEGDRVDGHRCTCTKQKTPPWAAAPARARPPSPPRRQTCAPFTLTDVHSRLEMLCLEIAGVAEPPPAAGEQPWWELTTPEAVEALSEAVAGVRATLDEQFLKCGDCGELMAVS